MCHRWFFSLGACVLSVGVASAQPAGLPTVPPSGSQVTPRALVTPPPSLDPSMFRVEPGDKVNKIPEARLSRLLTPPVSGPPQVPPVAELPPRKFNGEPLSNLYSPPRDFRVTPRSLIAPSAPSLDPSLFRVQPGEKANKIPEAQTNRQLTPPNSGPPQLPPLPELPNRGQR